MSGGTSRWKVHHFLRSLWNGAAIPPGLILSGFLHKREKASVLLVLLLLGDFKAFIYDLNHAPQKMLEELVPTYTQGCFFRPSHLFSHSETKSDVKFN